MGAPKQPRQKSKPKSGPESGKDQKKARYGASNPFSNISPETRRRWILKAKLNGLGRPVGQPDGWRKEDWEIEKAKIKAETKEIVKIMTEKLKIEDQYAVEALETAVEIMRSPLTARDRLGAAKLVLDFTKEKPSTKQEVTVQRAEDFLAAILKEENGPETS
jgi:hypothetical protein